LWRGASGRQAARRADFRVAEEQVHAPACRVDAHDVAVARQRERTADRRLRRNMADADAVNHEGMKFVSITQLSGITGGAASCPFAPQANQGISELYRRQHEQREAKQRSKPQPVNTEYAKGSMEWLEMQNKKG
jgi:hypothetical protein